MLGMSTAHSFITRNLICVNRAYAASLGSSIGYIIPVLNGYENTWCDNEYTPTESGGCVFQGARAHVFNSLFFLDIFPVSLKTFLLLFIYLYFFHFFRSLVSDGFDDDVCMLLCFFLD